MDRLLFPCPEICEEVRRPFVRSSRRLCSSSSQTGCLWRLYLARSLEPCRLVMGNRWPSQGFHSVFAIFVQVLKSRAAIVKANKRKMPRSLNYSSQVDQAFRVYIIFLLATSATRSTHWTFGVAHFALIPLKRSKYPSEFFECFYPQLMERIRFIYVSPTKPSFLRNFALFSEQEWALAVKHYVRVARRHLSSTVCSYCAMFAFRIDAHFLKRISEGGIRLCFV